MILWVTKRLTAQTVLCVFFINDNCTGVCRCLKENNAYNLIAFSKTSKKSALLVNDAPRWKSEVLHYVVQRIFIWQTNVRHESEETLHLLFLSEYSFLRCKQIFVLPNNRKHDCTLVCLEHHKQQQHSSQTPAYPACRHMEVFSNDYLLAANGLKSVILISKHLTLDDDYLQVDMHAACQYCSWRKWLSSYPTRTVHSVFNGLDHVTWDYFGVSTIFFQITLAFGFW